MWTCDVRFMQDHSRHKKACVHSSPDQKGAIHPQKETEKENNVENIMMEDKVQSSTYCDETEYNTILFYICP